MLEKCKNKKKCLDHFENKVLIPVIHVADEEQVLKNIEICFNYDIKQVFLINHSSNINYHQLLNIGKSVKSKYPTLWLGMNFLDLNGASVFSFLKDSKDYINGIWIDNSYVGLNIFQKKADELLRAWDKSNYPGLYFGGFAFKGQTQPVNLADAAQCAVGKMDIITTSWSATGVAADIDKIKTIRQNIGDSLLAIASGITYENIDNYLPYVDLFLVSSGISKDFYNFDETKVQFISEKIKQFNLDNSLKK